MQELFGGIEAGGTKFVCMVGTGPERVVQEVRFPTSDPEHTLQQVLAFFAPFVQRKELAAIGFGTFGPVDLNSDSPTYGMITSTPKKEWLNVDVRGTIQRVLDLPVALETDVNAAAWGEHVWVPENRILDPFLYVTVGTGIGVGILANGKPLHGMLHAEAGHFALPHDRGKDPFPGMCPFHGDCWEGLASGPAMRARWGQNAEDLPASHPGWDLEVDYLALGLADLIYAFSPQRIVLGGGVAGHAGLHQAVGRKVQGILNGYIHAPLILDSIEQLIVPPGLGNRSGVLGAIALAMDLVGAF
jgi:fructokinase